MNSAYVCPCVWKSRARRLWFRGVWLMVVWLLGGMPLARAELPDGGRPATPMGAVDRPVAMNPAAHAAGPGTPAVGASTTAGSGAVAAGGPSPAVSSDGGSTTNRDLAGLIQASEKQLTVVEKTLAALRTQLARLGQQVRHPCDEPASDRAEFYKRIRRDVATRGMGRIELETPSLPGGGLAQLRLPVSYEIGKELCVIGYWELGQQGDVPPPAKAAPSAAGETASTSAEQGLSPGARVRLEAEVGPCTDQADRCPELLQYGNAEELKSEGKQTRTRLRIAVPAHEPWDWLQLGPVASDPGLLQTWHRMFATPALLNVVVYERKGDDWKLLSAGRLNAPIRGQLASGILVLLLVALFYYLIARAVRTSAFEWVASVVQPAPTASHRTGEQEASGGSHNGTAGVARGSGKVKPGERMTLLERLNPLRITANPYGEASLSSLQFFGFSLLIGSLAFYRWALTGVLGSFPADLLILLGVSTGGSVAAQVVQQRAGLSEMARKDLTRRGWFAGSVRRRRPRLNQLLASAGKFDLSRMQAFVFSLIVAAYVLSSGIIDLGTVKIPTEMLSLMGLSQVIYVAGKAVAPAYVAAIEEGVEQLRTLEAQLMDPTLTESQRLLVRQTFDATVHRVASDFSGLFCIELSPPMLEPWLPVGSKPEGASGAAVSVAGSAAGANAAGVGAAAAGEGAASGRPSTEGAPDPAAGARGAAASEARSGG